MENKTLEELVILIQDWAKGKGILNIKSLPKQQLKLIEECGEVAGAILKGNEHDIKLEIGDCFVVLAIMHGQENPDYDFISKLKYPHLDTDTALSVMPYCAINDDEITTKFINTICNNLNLNLTECANLAWNKIKERKGKTVNGVFLKEDDLKD